jgi:hypothetical protein
MIFTFSRGKKTEERIHVSDHHGCRSSWKLSTKSLNLRRFTDSWGFSSLQENRESDQWMNCFPDTCHRHIKVMTLEGKLSLQSRSTRRNAYDFAAAQTTCWNCICCTHNFMSAARADPSSSWYIYDERSTASWSFFLRTHLDSCVE